VGDALLMTKPIGSGVLFNANLKGRVSEAAMASCLDWLTALNQEAARVLRGFEVHAVTDVTGFGLAGHGLEMAEASDVCLRFEIDAVPLLDEALAMYERGVTTGVNPVNRQLVEAKWRFDRRLPTWHEEIFVDPQTSGSLLVAAAPADADAAVDALREAGISAARRVGDVLPCDGKGRLVFA
ncbi:MAG: selenide, water dikinase SelD, partial [Holophagales bacterium]|nr:selenide, water dikinase SelD [Holophagales bacterium]